MRLQGLYWQLGLLFIPNQVHVAHTCTQSAESVKVIAGNHISRSHGKNCDQFTVAKNMWKVYLHLNGMKAKLYHTSKIARIAATEQGN